MGTGFDIMRAACQDCTSQKKADHCPEHSEYVTRVCWLTWPHVRYGGTTNAERYVAKFGWPKNGFKKEST